ncbi:hypothetical protein CDV31_009161 [Fusarium ambrosium]|uniref:Uncharacterized protein n=1 Tax=Fusarium ambrosium TaxID=131363 RepID=A0A428TWE2_9HYPO|nr:hypothetical protein CDV31_009161 [Fusarium ambrosium]
MEQNATYPPEHQGDKARAKSRRERGFDTESPLTQGLTFSELCLWEDFFDGAKGAKRCIQRYLEHMENIKKVDSITCDPPSTFEDRSLPAQALDGHSCSRSFLGVWIKHERKMMKTCAINAVYHLEQMRDSLHGIERFYKPPRNSFGPNEPLWVVICFISAAIIPFKLVAALVGAYAAIVTSPFFTNG